jgi:hypothetical protein
VKTDKLIEMLSTGVEPIDRRGPSRMLAVAAAMSVIAALGLMLLALRTRQDLVHAAAWPSLVLKVLFAGLLIVLAMTALGKVVRPGGEAKTSLAVLGLPFAAVMLLAIGALAVSPSSHWRAMVLGSQWLECLISIPLIAVVPFALITCAVRQAAPTNLARAGGLVGLAAGSMSAVGYAFHCTDDTIPFVALWYGGTIALCTLAGVKLGPRLLRW